MVPSDPAISTVALEDVTVVAEGLMFPEGPVACADGSVLVTEIEAGRVTGGPGGTREVVARCGGGPNGAAVGPDGALYVCNNGGRFADGNWKGGWVERVDLSSGSVDVLYTHDGDRRLSGPNDIVFDRTGAFWFTDTGKFQGRQRDVGSIYYATIDGNTLDEVVFPAESPNGIGIAPDGGTLYYAETVTARLRARRITGPGELLPSRASGPPRSCARCPACRASTRWPSTPAAAPASPPWSPVASPRLLPTAPASPSTSCRPGSRIT